MEAFRSHPRIGESRAPRFFAGPSSAAWSTQEQKKVADAGDAVKVALAEANREYEQRFGRIFIVCATGKSAPEILEILQRRLQNDAATELREAAEQQRQITRDPAEEMASRMKRISTHILDLALRASQRGCACAAGEARTLPEIGDLLASARTDQDGRALSCCRKARICPRDSTV